MTTALEALRKELKFVEARQRYQMGDGNNLSDHLHGKVSAYQDVINRLCQQIEKLEKTNEQER